MTNPTLTEDDLRSLIASLVPNGWLDTKRLNDCARALHFLNTATEPLRPVDFDNRSVVEANLEALGIPRPVSRNDELDRLLEHIDHRLRRACRDLTNKHGLVKLREARDNKAAADDIPESYWWARPATAHRTRKARPVEERQTASTKQTGQPRRRRH